MTKIHHIKRIPYKIALAIILLVGIGSLALHFGLSRHKQPSSKAVKTSDQAQRPINSVDYTPATPQEQPTADQKAHDSNPSKASEKSSVAVTLSALGQDTPGGSIVVRALIGNVSGGTCTITAERGSVTMRYSTDVQWQGTYYSCAYDIPYLDLGAGSWTIDTTATQGDQTGSAAKTIEVRGN